jgi:hypothetical protein
MPVARFWASSGFPLKKAELRRLGSAQTGDEKRLGAGAPIWLTGFLRFSGLFQKV